uniref:Bestrophin homolog n=1 Tax=Caenorhabditis japonica TaxID=281687 RepID=A0A8R1HYU4_CAEJA
MRQVEEENKPTASLLNQFIGELRIFRQSLRKLYSYDWVCVPLVYTQVAALATYAFFFFSLFGRQVLIPDIESGRLIDLRVPVFTIVQFLFFVGWFKVGQDLMRPFGLDDDDIELNYILDRNVRISFDIVDRLQESPLPDFENDDDKFWNQMNAESLDENGGRKSVDGLKIPLLPHSKYSRQLSEHPPRLHAYVPIDDEKRIKDVESQHGCMRLKKEKKHLSW